MKDHKITERQYGSEPYDDFEEEKDESVSSRMVDSYDEMKDNVADSIDAAKEKADDSWNEVKEESKSIDEEIEQRWRDYQMKKKQKE